MANAAYKKWYDDKWKKEAIHLTHQLGLLTKAIKKEPSREAVDAMSENIQSVKDSLYSMMNNIVDLEKGQCK